MNGKDKVTCQNIKIAWDSESNTMEWKCVS